MRGNVSDIRHPKNKGQESIFNREFKRGNFLTHFLITKVEAAPLTRHTFTLSA